MSRNSSHFSRPDSGFTLMELMMAIAISAIIITIVTSTFYSSHTSIKNVSEQKEVYEMVRIVMDRMTKDITCSYIPCERKLDEREMTMYIFEGRNEKQEDTDTDSLYLTTSADIGLSRKPQSLCEVGYYLEKDEGEELYSLVRRENCAPHEGVAATGTEIEIAENLLSMNIEYIESRTKTQDEWDLSEKLKLPEKVRVTLTFRTKTNEEISFSAVASPALSGHKIKRKE